MSKSINVLIVDDHKIIRDGIRSMLIDERDIVIVGEEENGNAALKTLGSKEVDVVLSDISMPVMGGSELTKNINEFHPNVKVLILSMHEEEQYIKDLIDHGASGYILKNTGASELIKAIRTVAEGKNFFSNEVYSTLIMGNNKKANTTDVIQLTKREIEVLKLISNEMKNHEIAEALFVSIRTVDTHRRNLLQKLNVKNTAGLVRYAVKSGIVD